MRKKKLLLTAFLVTPILLLVVILVVLKYTRPAMNAPPIGAGAGDTGGANAIGEYLAHGSSRPIIPGNTPPAPPPEPATQVPAETPKPVIQSIEPARTVYPRGTLTTLNLSPAPNAAAQVQAKVFTPPGYEPAGAITYPLLLLIGDNVFDPTGWALDDTASELISRGNMDSAIIAALPSPSASVDRVAYARWVAKDALTSLRANYRIKQGSEVTGIGGSGRDAWTALTVATYHPDNIGVLLIHEPSAGGALEEFQPPRRAFIGDTTQNADPHVIKQLEQNLKSAGMGRDRLLVLTDDNQPNDPAALRQRTQHALAFLYPPQVDPTK